MHASQSGDSAGAESFPSTCWSRIIADPRGGEEASKRAFDAVARRYFRPIVAYARARSGKSDEEARDVASRVNRGVCRRRLALVLAESGATAAAGDALAGALADFDAAILNAPEQAVVWFDRALLHNYRARIAQLGLRTEAARLEYERARSDARAALDAASESHPFRWRFEALVSELE